MTILPNRKTIRLQCYDYSQNGAYFITICTKNKVNLFGTINDGMMHLNQLGEIVSQHIHAIADHAKHVTLANAVVMPNHLHLLLILISPLQQDTAYPAESGAFQSHEARASILCAKSLQIIPRAIQQFKASVTRETKNADLWQSRYHDHVIRDERSFQKIWAYIDSNPLKWESDCFYNAINDTHNP
ncbi:MAG: transposase [Clostridia bacterium]